MNSDSKNIAKIFRKDNRLEKVLQELNEELKGLFSEKLTVPERPIILIMGCARSGSTLLLQYLSQLGIFSYPTNLIARFYKNPFLGIKIQQALLDFDPLNQLEFKNSEQNYSSTLGKTFGALAPSEFWYFWRQYFDFSQSEYNYLKKDKLTKVNTEEFIKKISAFENLTSKPLVMKGMMLNWNIPFLYSLYDKFIFINIKRNIISNAQSLLTAREKYFNDKTKWYSFKPKEYENLKHKTPQEQVIGQVYYTQRAVDEGFKDIPDKNKIVISYKEFCQNPFQLIKILKNHYSLLGDNLNIEDVEIKTKEMFFKTNNAINLSKKDRILMDDFLEKIKK